MQSAVDQYCQSLPQYNYWFISNETDRFNVCLYDLCIEIQMQDRKQQELVESTITKNIQAIYAFLCSLESKPNRLGPSLDYENE